MTELTVINGKQWGFIGSDRLYIGRATKYLQASPLANPYILGRDGDRNTIIARYKIWLWEQIKHKNNQAYKHLEMICSCLRDGNSVKLSCYCKPEACHGDIIKAAVEWLLKQGIGDIPTWLARVEVYSDRPPKGKHVIKVYPCPTDPSFFSFSDVYTFPRRFDEFLQNPYLSGKFFSIDDAIDAGKRSLEETPS